MCLIFYPFLILFCFFTFSFLMIFNFYKIKKIIFQKHFATHQFGKRWYRLYKRLNICQPEARCNKDNETKNRETNETKNDFINKVSCQKYQNRTREFIYSLLQVYSVWSCCSKTFSLFPSPSACPPSSYSSRFPIFALPGVSCWRLLCGATLS
jgi:hypothetical protein